jgi:HK97 family phage major capsid protein
MNMTKHIQIETRSALPIETREDDPLAAAIANVEAIRTAAEQRATEHQTEVRALTDRLASMETRLNRPNGGQQEQRNEPTEEQRAFSSYIRRGEQGLSDVERRALTVGADATAGFLAPPEFGTRIIEALQVYSPIRQYASVVQVGGREIRYPRRVAGTNFQWVSETGNRPESQPTYDQVTLTPWELAGFTEISRQLLEDSVFDIDAELRKCFAIDIAQKEGAAFVIGDGNGKPKGILSAGTGIPEVVSGNASTLGSAPADLLIDALTKLGTPNAANSAFMMNGKTLGMVRKLKDQQGAYLWQPSIQAGAPTTLLGRPVIEAPDMPDIGAGAFPIVVGNFREGYLITDRVDISVLVDPFTRATNGIVRFHGRKRTGGDVVDPTRFVKVKVAAA